jgi:hypothetical protein
MTEGMESLYTATLASTAIDAVSKWAHWKAKANVLGGKIDVAEAKVLAEHECEVIARLTGEDGADAYLPAVGLSPLDAWVKPTVMVEDVLRQEIALFAAGVIEGVAMEASGAWSISKDNVTEAVNETMTEVFGDGWAMLCLAFEITSREDVQWYKPVITCVATEAFCNRYKGSKVVLMFKGVSTDIPSITWEQYQEALSL